MTEAILFLGHHFPLASQDSSSFISVFSLPSLFPHHLFRGIRQVKGYGCMLAYKLDGALRHSEDEYVSGIISLIAVYKNAFGTVFTF